ncbi:anthranilate phosphoribosyltransferase family protein [Lyngbya aestuarii]|uniref:anthranilate phosphoribosyltransferase family protein n=1 Tax=Lyngbya aestuarii TaxID=118322 RepID=UPI00403DCA52
MSNEFRELLRKIGSGTHTGKSLSRAEAAEAARMMLLQEATPAQIGAFLIAHRIKRPTGEELAGMLDTYDQLGPALQPITTFGRVTVLSSPYDGRSRTAPLSPLTALVLSAAGCPVVMHGGERMPTKEGVPLIDLWRGLGVDWTQLTLKEVQQVLETAGLGFVYLPTHFPLAQGLVPYREQIGKRPPLATLELIWSPYRGESQVVAGFVHPPTEEMIRSAFALRGTPWLITVKGLEGSCDLPSDRTAIIGITSPGEEEPQFERLCLAPRAYGFAAQSVPLEATEQLTENMQAVLQGKPSSLMQAVVWNSGFYLWRCGVCPDLEKAIAKAKVLLSEGQVWQKLQQLREISPCCVKL